MLASVKEERLTLHPMGCSDCCLTLQDLVAGFDQEAAAVVLVRLASYRGWKTEAAADTGLPAPLPAWPPALAISAAATWGETSWMLPLRLPLRVLPGWGGMPALAQNGKGS